MRTVLARRLAVFLILAMSSGGMVRAEMLFAAAACHDVGIGHAGHHHHDESPQKQDSSLPCCIDCLGCATFAGGQEPALVSTPVLMVSIVRYLDRVADRGGRTLRPEPGPPRTSA